MIALKDATPLEKWAYKIAIGIGYRMAEHRLKGSPPSLLLRSRTRRPTGSFCATFASIGVDRCRMLYTVRHRSLRT